MLKRFRLRSVVLSLALALLFVGLATQLVAQDSTATGPAPAEAQFALILGVVGGLVGTVVTNLFKRGFTWLTGEDSKLVSWYKPFQPIVATVLGFVVPVAFGALHLHGIVPSGSTVAAAPLSTILFIVLREVYVSKLGGDAGAVS